MNFKKLITLLFFINISLMLNAQEVKIKKGTVTIDGNQYVKWDRGMFTVGPHLVSYHSNKTPIFSLNWKSYEEPNPLREKSELYPETKKVGYIILKFVDFDAEMTTYMSTKDLMKAMYNMEVISEDGSVNQENAYKMIRLYNEEIKNDETIIIIKG